MQETTEEVCRLVGEVKNALDEFAKNRNELFLKDALLTLVELQNLLCKDETFDEVDEEQNDDFEIDENAKLDESVFENLRE
jgi:hypothetical protein